MEMDPLVCSLTPENSVTFWRDPEKRRNSAEYWKTKSKASQEIVKQLSEYSIQLEQIPGLLTLQKVKPKMSKELLKFWLYDWQWPQHGASHQRKEGK